jgi:hypothetical protein
MEESNMPKDKMMKFTENKLRKKKLLVIIKKFLTPKEENFLLGMDTLQSQKKIPMKNQVLVYKFLRIFEVKWVQNNQLMVGGRPQ